MALPRYQRINTVFRPRFVVRGIMDSPSSTQVKFTLGLTLHPIKLTPVTAAGKHGTGAG
jgi:hypothetical protein